MPSQRPGKIVATILFVLVMCSVLPAANREIVLDSLYLEDGRLFVDFHISNLLDDKTLEGLRKGFTSRIVHQVRLWKTTKIVSSIAAEVEYSVIALYDNWEKKYAIVTNNERRLTGNIERLRRQCSVVTAMEIADTSQVKDNTTYYLSIHSIFQPMSDDSYGDLREWISKKSDHPKPNKKSRGRFFGMLLELMGFGDSSLNYKSPDFVLRNKSQLRFVE